MTNRSFFWLVVAAALLLGLGPTLVGYWLTPHGYLFYGNSVLNPADASVYYSYINQARLGHFVMSDVFTSEPYAATLWQPFWWVVGILAWPVHLSTIFAYGATRVLGILVLAATLWWAIRWVFPDQARQRWALALSLLGAGVGGVIALVGRMQSPTAWPDLWVSEAFPVLTLMTSPHFLFITSGMIFVLVAVERAWLELKWKWAIWAAVIAALTLLIHPFHALTWIILWGLLTVWRWWRQHRVPWRYLGGWLLVLAGALPVFILYGTQLLFDPVTIGRAAQNENLTWTWWKTIISLGAFLPAAWLAWRNWAGHRARSWVMAWGLATIIAIYLPLLFQRRLSQGMLIPFALFATPGVVRAWEWLRRRELWWRGPAILVIGLLFFGSGLRAAIVVTQGYVQELTTGQSHLFYLSPEYQSLLNILSYSGRREQPLLATYTNSLALAGLTTHRVFVAHGVETLHFETKRLQMQNFYQSWSPDQQHQFIEQQKICFILDGPRERGYGTAFHGDQWPDLTVTWRGPTMTLYHWQQCR